MDSLCQYLKDMCINGGSIHVHVMWKTRMDERSPDNVLKLPFNCNLWVEAFFFECVFGLMILSDILSS